MHLLQMIFLSLTLLPNFVRACREFKCAGDATYPIHLTFDDGPDLENTRKILKILNKQNIKATFFCLAEEVEKSKSKQAIVDEIVAANHSVGSHSYQHVHHTTLNQKDLLEQISKSKKILNTWLTKPPLFRLPHGDGWPGAFTLNPDRSRAVMSAIRKFGFRHVGWDSMPFDWDKKVQRKPGILKVLAKEICEKNGGVIVLHDTQPNTAKHLNEWIEALKCVGHRFVGLDEAQGRNSSVSESLDDKAVDDKSLPK